MKNYPFKIALLYFVIGAAWIICTDWLSNNYSASFSILIQNAKGLLFVALSALVLFVIIKRYYRQINQKQVEYLRLFQDNPHPMWVYDVDTLSFLAVNNAAVEKYGYSKNEFLQKKITDIRPESEKELLSNFVKRSNDTIYLDSGIWQHQTKEREAFYVRISSHSTIFENKKARVVLAIDVDDQVSAQRELQLSENKLKGLINNSDDLIWLINKEGIITAANEAFQVKIRKVLGITLDFTKHADINFFPENDFTRNWRQYFLKALKGESLKVEEEIANGQREFFEIILNPIYDNENDVIGVGCFARDITQRKKYENRIKEQVEKLKEISWIQSHEMRRPAANIIGLIELLKTSNNAEEKGQLMHLLEESSKELDFLIKRIVEKSSTIQ